MSVCAEELGLTVLEVFKTFFSNLRNGAVYVCDSADDRATCQKRKFDLWSWKYNDGTMIKEDDIALIEGTEIYNSMIIHRRNEKLAEIILAYKELNEKAADK